MTWLSLWSSQRSRLTAQGSAPRTHALRTGALAHSARTDMHVYIEDIAKHEGQPVTIKGWLAGRRSSGKIHFLQVRDGSGFIQAVMSKAAVGDETFSRADHLSQESAVIVTGTARADTRAPGGFE